MTLMIALTTTTIGMASIFVVVVVGWIIYYLLNVAAGRKELGSEIELAPNRKPYYDDEILEGPRLERVQLLGVAAARRHLVIGLPLYWVFEPSRQAGRRQKAGGALRRLGLGAVRDHRRRRLQLRRLPRWHEGRRRSGAVHRHRPDTGEVQAVNWYAPALNTVFYRFGKEEVRFILNYGRPFSPMSPWGLAGGGPMNDQQIENLLAYLKSIQIPPRGLRRGRGSVDLRCRANLPAEIQTEIQTAVEKAVADGERRTREGEALFNLDLASGAYSCARCHTLGWSYGDPASPARALRLEPHRRLDEQRTSRTRPTSIQFIKTGSVYGKQYGMQGQGSGRMPGFGRCSPMSRSRPSSNTCGVCEP